MKVERVGKVTICQRGAAYYLYYRQGGASQRRRVDGNLAVARAAASKVLAALEEGWPSPAAYTRTSPGTMVEGYLDSAANVTQLALRTRGRYRAALDRFLGLCRCARVGTVDAAQRATAEDFVRRLRGRKRARNGAARGERAFYQVGGVRFILSTCRTAFDWAARRRMLPPFAQNPFLLFGVAKLTDPAEKVEKARAFTPEQEAAFFAACDGWQRAVFSVLAAYGLRVGELTHPLVEDVGLANGSFAVRSKPWPFWTVKTGRERRLPLLPGTREVFEGAIGGRRAGFVFLNKARPPTTPCAWCAGARWRRPPPNTAPARPRVRPGPWNCPSCSGPSSRCVTRMAPA